MDGYEVVKVQTVIMTKLFRRAVPVTISLLYGLDEIQNLAKVLDAHLFQFGAELRVWVLASHWGFGFG